jgi:hypothetical protein
MIFVVKKKLEGTIILIVSNFGYSLNKPSGINEKIRDWVKVVVKLGKVM